MSIDNIHVVVTEEIEIDNIHENCSNNVCCQKKCSDLCAHLTGSSSSWEWFGLFVLWFIALTVLFWLIFYSLKPPFVLQDDGNQVDTGKVLLAAVISSFVLIVLIWLIKAAMGK